MHLKTPDVLAITFSYVVVMSPSFACGDWEGREGGSLWPCGHGWAAILYHPHHHWAVALAGEKSNAPLKQHCYVPFLPQGSFQDQCCRFCLSPATACALLSFRKNAALSSKQLSPAGHHGDSVGRAMGMEVSLSLSPAEASPAEDTQAKLVILSTAEPSWAQQLKSGDTTQTIPAFGRFVHLFFHCLVLGDWEHHLRRASAILSLSQQPSTLSWGGNHLLYIKHLLFGILLLFLLCCSSVFLIVLLSVFSELLSQPISAFVPLSLEQEWGEQEQVIWSLILCYF